MRTHRHEKYDGGMDGWNKEWWLGGGWFRGSQQLQSCTLGLYCTNLVNNLLVSFVFGVRNVVHTPLRLVL